MSRDFEDPPGSPRIADVQARGRSGILVYFSDGSVVEIVPIPAMIAGFREPFDLQQAVLRALRDLLQRAARRDGRDQRNGG
jgi:hypothetical protein